jgi:hypothetical protein
MDELLRKLNPLLSLMIHGDHYRVQPTLLLQRRADLGQQGIQHAFDTNAHAASEVLNCMLASNCFRREEFFHLKIEKLGRELYQFHAKARGFSNQGQDCAHLVAQRSMGASSNQAAYRKCYRALSLQR